ncbi:oxidoreductase [Seminibacterium arietis]|uniref:Oxidoreductase n=1 Tax=Seminibacterium arietis TaxID=1173502 RepID=A0ABW3I691_9PAST
MLNIAIAAEFELAEKIAASLENSSLPVKNLVVVEIEPFSEEQGIRFKNKGVAQISPQDMNWSDYHYFFFAGNVDDVPCLVTATQAGCMGIDIKGVCANLSEIPLVIPTINETALCELRQRNIVSLPNPQITQCCLAISPLLAEIEVTQLMVTSLLPAAYQSVESVGRLASQTAQLLNGIPLNEEEQRLAFDVFPQQENYVMQFSRIFPEIQNVTFHSIQVPVFYGMGQKITALCLNDINVDNLTTCWQQNGIIEYHQRVITPVTNGERETNEKITKLHISSVENLDNGVSFWAVADEQRFTQASMAVKLAEAIYHQDYQHDQ